MLWMGVWIRHRAIIATLVGPDLGSQPPNDATVSGRGSKPTWNGSHIHSKPLQSDWQPSNAVDCDMDLSSCHYYHTLVGSDLGSVSWDLHHWWCAHKWWHGTVVEAQNPHGMAPMSTQTHTIWLTTFICSGRVYGSVIVPLSPHLLAQIWEVILQIRGDNHKKITS